MINDEVVDFGKNVFADEGENFVDGKIIIIIKLILLVIDQLTESQYILAQKSTIEHSVSLKVAVFPIMESNRARNFSLFGVIDAFKS